MAESDSAGYYWRCSDKEGCGWSRRPEEQYPHDGKLVCPKCGGDLVYRFTKDKGLRFIGCINFPKCKYNEFPNTIQPKKTGLKCPECGGDLVLKLNKHKRKFVGCNNYPKCNFIMKTNSKMIKSLEAAIAENKVPDIKVEKAVFEKILREKNKCQ